MTIWILIIAMVIAAMLLLALPLIRRKGRGETRAAYDRQVYRDQLDEIVRDEDRGVIGTSAAAAARTEIERRLLATAPEAEVEEASPQDRQPLTGLAQALVILSLVLVPAAGGWLYLKMGSPDQPDQPFAERSRQVAAPQGISEAQIREMVAIVEQRLIAKPKEIQGWIILSTAYLRFNRDADAQLALDRSLNLAAKDPVRASRIAHNFAQALTARHDGQVTARARAAFERAKDLNPANPGPPYYLGLAKMQDGDAKGAIDIWRRLMMKAPVGAPWRAMLKRRIERVARERGIDPQIPDDTKAPPALTRP